MPVLTKDYAVRDEDNYVAAVFTDDSRLLAGAPRQDEAARKKKAHDKKKADRKAAAEAKEEAAEAATAAKARPPESAADAPKEPEKKPLSRFLKGLSMSINLGSRMVLKLTGAGMNSVDSGCSTVLIG
jgi:membrane protein involved in colicin uptake